MVSGKVLWEYLSDMTCFSLFGVQEWIDDLFLGQGSKQKEWYDDKLDTALDIIEQRFACIRRRAT